MYNPVKPFKKKIIEAIRSTWHTPYVSVRFDTYPIVERKHSYPEIDHTDGIGTKGVYHWKAKTLRAAVIDALAMNLNDLALLCATPYKLSNHITVPQEDIRMLQMVKAMARECRKRNIAIVGGENSFQNTIEGMDISMTVTGFITKPRKNVMRRGDVLIGLKSSGLHSNGFSTVRSIFKKEMRKEFTIPTRIYSNDILRLNAHTSIHGMMHITGGAFAKLKDVLGNNDAEIVHSRLLPQPIFREMYERGLSNQRMYTTFNCGIGYILSVPQKDIFTVKKYMRGAEVIGRVVKGDGSVKIKSAFNGKTIIL